MNESKKNAIEELISIKNELGPKTASKLFDAGITSLEKLYKTENSEIIRKLYEVNYPFKKVETILIWKKVIEKEDYLYSIAKSKHSQLLDRDFEKNIEYYIFKNNFDEIRISSNINKEFIKFVNDEESKLSIIRNYIKKCQNYDSAYGLDKRYNKFLKYYKTNSHNNIYDIFQKEFKSKLLTLDLFMNVYGKNTDDRKCSYCFIKESIIAKLIEAELILSKELWHRGRRKEIDKKNPLKGYTEKNITLSCYWCNNAKTDEFVADNNENFEFESIGIAIRQIWNARIDKFNVKNKSEKIERIENNKK